MSPDLPDRYVNSTSAPSAASRRVISAPMPQLPPVTNGTLPASRPVISMPASSAARRPGQDTLPPDPYETGIPADLNRLDRRCRCLSRDAEEMCNG